MPRVAIDHKADSCEERSGPQIHKLRHNAICVICVCAAVVFCYLASVIVYLKCFSWIVDDHQVTWLYWPLFELCNVSPLCESMARNIMTSCSVQSEWNMMLLYYRIQYIEILPLSF